MDLMESFGYLAEGIKGLIVGGVGYFGILAVMSIVQDIGKRIKSQEELEKIVEEEAIKLGLDPSKIDSKYEGEITGARKNEKGYDLHTNNFYSGNVTRGAIRHELYHILKDCDTTHPTFFRRWFMGEPKAILYGAFKIKI